MTAIAQLSPTTVYPFMTGLLWQLWGNYQEGLCEGFCNAAGIPIEGWEGADTGLDPLPWVYETLLGLKGVTHGVTAHECFKALGLEHGRRDAVDMGVVK